MLSATQSLLLPPIMKQLLPLLERQAQPVYLVGGAVRDALLGEISYDLDFTMAESAVELAFQVGDALGAPVFVMDRERDISRVVLEEAGTMLDFARFRGKDLEEDLGHRDFTINALALPAGEATVAAVIDLGRGLSDLRRGLVRVAYPQAIADDPVRALRAVRIAARFGFQLTPETAAAVQAEVLSLSQVSVERVRDEVQKLLQTGRPGWAIEQMLELGLLHEVLPEIAALQGVEQSPPHHEPVLEHTIHTLERLVDVERVVVWGEPAETPYLLQAQARLASFSGELQQHLEREIVGEVNGRLLLRLAGLFHDAGKAVTQTKGETGRIHFLGHDEVGARLAARRLRALRFSNEVVRGTATIVNHHMRPLFLAQAGQVSRRAAFRFFRDSGAAGLDVGLLSLADHLATYNGPGAPETWQRLLDVVRELFYHYLERYEETVAPEPLLDGNQLMAALDLKPGPQVGRLLRLLQEAQASGDITTPEEALVLVQTARTREK